MDEFQKCIFWNTPVDYLFLGFMLLIIKILPFVHTIYYTYHILLYFFFFFHLSKRRYFIYFFDGISFFFNCFITTPPQFFMFIRYYNYITYLLTSAINTTTFCLFLNCFFFHFHRRSVWVWDGRLKSRKRWTCMEPQMKFFWKRFENTKPNWLVRVVTYARKTLFLLNASTSSVSNVWKQDTIRDSENVPSVTLHSETMTTIKYICHRANEFIYNTCCPLVPAFGFNSSSEWKGWDNGVMALPLSRTLTEK